MTADEERWAEALKIYEMYGENAPLWVAERMGAVALAGDVDGIERFIQIAARLDHRMTGQLQ